LRIAHEQKLKLKAGSKKGKGKGKSRVDRSSTPIGVDIDTSDEEDEDEDEDGAAPWWAEVLDGVEDLRSIEHSGKMVALMKIIEGAVEEKEKVLVFTQSKTCLTLMEELLAAKFNWKKTKQFDR
jgi:SNF2 family DNA or RNA helicase